MSLISDILLLTAAIAAAIYCRALAVRLKKLSNTDTGIGGVISALSAQTEDLKVALLSLATESENSSAKLQENTRLAEMAARRLELLLAALHEKPEPMDDTCDAQQPLKLSSKDRITEVYSTKVETRKVLRNAHRHRIGGEEI